MLGGSKDFLDLMLKKYRNLLRFSLLLLAHNVE